MSFRDRSEAGRQLARRLAALAQEAPLVVGIPRGGALVAAEVARILRAPLDVVAVRRIAAPHAPHAPLGAVAEEGQPFLIPGAARRHGLGAEALARLVAREQGEAAEWGRDLRDGRELSQARGRPVLLVDDGAAAGARATAAARLLRSLGAERLVLALPVVAPAARDTLERECDELIWLDSPPDFLSVGYWYARCANPGDAELAALLSRWREREAELRSEERGAGARL
ncbi:MAG TPA: phosphoribosyltransferase family protein [Anaeromyxobacteraceae bacterium]|nr:phosphoribosyltransferase family protein [Anaeromyxobacteraceae bacterium]